MGFKSEFLSLVSSKSQNESQLLMAEEALAIARQDQAELQKSNTWLTGAFGATWQEEMRWIAMQRIRQCRMPGPGINATGAGAQCGD